MLCKMFVVNVTDHGTSAVARSQLILCCNFLVCLFLTASDSGQVRQTFQLLERVHSAIKSLQKVAQTEDALALLRPVVLRMHTVFTQAALIMGNAPAPTP